MMVELNKNGIKINGREEILLCASFFYFRIPKKNWASRARLLSSLGYNCVDIYFPWNFHESEPGMTDFSEERDVDCFLRICEENNLFVIARPGPYICSEWDGGGLPSWVICGNEIRQNDGQYLMEVKKWYDKILPIIARHQIGGLENGSVILLQLENELDFFDCLDVTGYMEGLRKMALDNGITVPLFACAGQGDIKRSGGLTDGIVPTYNFYPLLTDGTFDYKLSQYAKFIRGKNLPMLVTETDRKHSILKRELLAGAKLLGAYNQVGGTNFGYYQSVNNWGNPLSLICTLYDFDGMIDNLGCCTEEADEALLLSELIRVFGKRLAAGEWDEIDSPVPAVNAVRLADDGGTLLCVRSVEDKELHTVHEYEGNAFELSFSPFEAFALPFHLQMENYEIIFSNNEIFSLKPLVFIERSKPFLLIEKAGRRIIITGNGIYDGIDTGFISREEAIAEIKKKRKTEIRYRMDLKPLRITNCLVGAYENQNEFHRAVSPLFSDNKIWYGEAEYRIKTNNRKLFLKGAGDFLTVKNDDKVVFSGLCFCDDVIVDGKGEVRAFVEKWGNSNFDDSRKRSLRIKAERGIEKIYEIISKKEITKWRFTEVDSFSEHVIIEKSETDPCISINSWNSTKEPLFAAYYTEISPRTQPGEELLLFLDGLEAECNLFINGVFVFKFTQASGSVNISGLIRTNEKNLVELCVRKSDWTKKTGNLFLMKVVPCEFDIRQVVHTDAYHSMLKPAKLPLAIEKGEMYSACIENPVQHDTYGYVKGSGFRATVMQNRKVIARIVADSDKIVQAGCLDNSQFLIPFAADGNLYFFIEAMNNGSFEFAIGEDDDEAYKN